TNSLPHHPHRLMISILLLIFHIIGGYFASYFAENVSSRLTVYHRVSKVQDLSEVKSKTGRLDTNRV
ncbi:hypothetical protein, partial [uncultured Duncaniella sp.]|uniref:hypothetical protein n=1 Tax=uncultured Duncaniella sp. TaxID=2768039 RepID=UPI00263365C7